MKTLHKYLAQRQNQIVFSADKVGTSDVEQKLFDRLDKAQAKATMKAGKLEYALSQLERWALEDWNDVELKVSMPAITSKQDKRKVSGIVVAIHAAVAEARRHNANSLRMAYTVKHGWQRIDHISQLSNAISKFKRLNPAVLKGGEDLKNAIIQQAWNSYAMLEVMGEDNAHYIQANIPCNDRSEIAKDSNKLGFNDYDWFKQSERYA